MGLVEVYLYVERGETVAVACGVSPTSRWGVAAQRRHVRMVDVE